MASRGEFLALGSALDRVLPKVRRDMLERLLPALLAQPAAARPLLAQVMAGAYATGVQTGWMVHGSLLGGVPSTLTGQTAREWRDRAYEHGEFIANRFGKLLELEPTVAQLRQHAAVAGESSVWKGQDEIAEEVAALVEAEYKVWVRAWPRKEQRDWHDALEGVTIPEDHLFTLPGGPNAGAQVYGPRDWEAVPKPGEHLNCGHALRYQRGATAEDLEQTRKGVGVVYTPPTKSEVWADYSEHELNELLAGSDVLARIGRIDEDMAEALGASTRGVKLGKDTIEKQRKHHPELDESIYRDFTQLMQNADLVTLKVKDGKETLGVYSTWGSQPVLVTLRATHARNEVFLVSLHHVKEQRKSSPGATAGKVVVRRKK